MLALASHAGARKVKRSVDACGAALEPSSPCHRARPLSSPLPPTRPCRPPQAFLLLCGSMSAAMPFTGAVFMVVIAAW
jgi:hypothetical protein